MGEEGEPAEPVLSWRARALLGRLADPADALEVLVAVLHEADDPEEAAGVVGSGPLESLFHQGHGEALWPRIEELAHADPVFRRALSNVWVDHPGLPELLEDLGERWTATFTAVLYPTRLAPGGPLGARALQVDPPIAPRELARILRLLACGADEQADQLDRRVAVAASPRSLRPENVGLRYALATLDAASDPSDAGDLWIERLVHDGVVPDGEAPADVELWLEVIRGCARAALDLHDPEATRKVLLRLGAAVEALCAQHPEQLDRIESMGATTPGKELRAALAAARQDAGTLDGWWWSTDEWLVRRFGPRARDRLRERSAE